MPFLELPQPGLGVPDPPVANNAMSGPIVGHYRYRVSFVGIAGESTPSSPSASVNGLGFGVSLTLPLGPDPYTRGRNIYRTAVNGSGRQRVPGRQRRWTIPRSCYLDTLPDATLGGPMPAGDSTVNQPLVELRISSARLPGVTTPGNLQLTFGCKHLWSAGGTTLPEQHHDIVLLGAAAYAIGSYTVPTGDLFDYQDGELRDRVNQTKVAPNWLALEKLLAREFEQRLKEVKQQRDASYADVAQWGSVSSRWQWT